MPDDLLIAYVTCPTIEEARRIAHALVEQRLAACVNIRAHEAIYRWEGQVESAPEFALLAKTTAAAFPRLRDAVLALHSYALPCIVATPITAGHPAFLDWIATEASAVPSA